MGLKSVGKQITFFLKISPLVGWKIHFQCVFQLLDSCTVFFSEWNVLFYVLMLFLTPVISLLDQQESNFILQCLFCLTANDTLKQV